MSAAPTSDVLPPSAQTTPRTVTVGAVVSSRYEPRHRRPASWDGRRAGTDVIETVDGETISLRSDGGQSPPRPGWTIVLTSGDQASGHTWTLYGLARGPVTSSAV